MQFATHYYLLIDWVGEGEGEGKGKGEGVGEGEGRKGKCLARGRDVRKLSFTISGFSFNSFKQTIL